MTQVTIERLDERVISLTEKIELYQANSLEAHERHEKSFETLSKSLDNLSAQIKGWQTIVSFTTKAALSIGGMAAFIAALVQIFDYLKR